MAQKRSLSNAAEYGVQMQNIAESTKSFEMCSTLVIAVTGSVGAAAILPEFLLLSRRVFAKRNQVLLSKSAMHFIQPYVAELYSGIPVITDMFDSSEFCVPHLQTTREAEILLVMPATANIIGKAAHGIADDLISTTILAADCPIVFAPNMNYSMWSKTVVQCNIEALRRQGHHIVEPTTGIEVSTAEETFGCMPSAKAILKALVEILMAQRIKLGSGEKILATP